MVCFEFLTTYDVLKLLVALLISAIKLVVNMQPFQKTFFKYLITIVHLVTILQLGSFDFMQ